MPKNIIKEIIIILLLTLAIILILGVLLYEYIPSNKIIPEKISYITPDNAKEALQTDPSVDDAQVVVTYQIDSTDLNNYQKIKEYVPGKKNPFENTDVEETTNETSIESNKVNNAGNTKNDSSSSSNTNTNINTSTSTGSSTGYLPDKGTK